jgi:hypothetical protein
MRILACIVNWLIVICCTHAYAQDASSKEWLNKDSLKPFIAYYKITILRDKQAVWLSGQAQHKLSFKDGRGTFVFDASLLTAEVHELSKFDILNAKIRPLYYSSKAKGLISGTQQIDFYNNLEAKYFIHNSNKANPVVINNHTFDVASWLMQIRLDLINKKPRLNYYVIDKQAKVKNIDYKIVNYRDFINTPIGKFNTIRVEKDLLDAESDISVWFAPKWNYLIIKMITQEYMLELTSAAILESDGNKTIVKDNAQYTEKSLH